MCVSAPKSGGREAQHPCTSMNRDHLQGICRQLSGRLRECWGTLQRDPAAVADARRDRLAGRIQEQRAVSKQAADRQIADFRNRNRDWLDISKH
jgi:uncharacterized protein YjbJ (UPF0337 family)